MSALDVVRKPAPELDVLSAGQEEQVTQLLAQVKAQYGNAYPPQFARCRSDEDRRVLAYKYLKARKWSLKDAMEMVTEVMKFREENKLDGMPLFPCPFPLRGYDQADLNRRLGLPERPKGQMDTYYRAIASNYPHALHFYDKRGHPVIVDRVGSSRVYQLLKSMQKCCPVGQRPSDVGVAYFTYLSEVVLALERNYNILMEEQEAASNSPKGLRSYSCVMILDTENLSIKMFYKPVVDILRAALTAMQKHYPDGVYQLIVINSPGIIKAAYALVKNTLDENTQNKVIFCTKSETLDVLREVVDEKHIPAILGGKCNCEGGCIPVLGGGDGADSGEGSGDDSELATEEVSVSAGKSHVVAYALESGDEVVWHFAPIGSDDGVKFSATFTDPGNGTGGKAAKGGTGGSDSKGEAVVAAHKAQETEGAYVATRAGTLRLVWDNTASWMYAKKVQMRLAHIKRSDTPTAATA